MDRLKTLRPLALAVSVAALGGVVWWAAHQDAPTLPSSGSQIAALIGAVLIYGVSTSLRAERWGWLLRHSHAHPTRADSYGLTLVGYMGNNVLPARGGDLMRVYLMAPRAGTGKRVVIGSLLAERLLDVITFAGVFVGIVYIVRYGQSAQNADRAAVALAVAFVLAVIAVPVWYRLRRRGQLQKLADFIRPMVALTKSLLSRKALPAIAITLLLWAVEAVLWWAVGSTTEGLHLTYAGALYLMAITSMFLLIPAGPGYVGTMDAAIIIGVKSLNGSSAAALSYVITLRFVLLVPITTAGLVALVTRYGGWSVSRRARAEARAEAGA